jgi:orotate phosphoribosyltransferase
VGAGAIINRGRNESTLGLPFASLVNMEVPVYQPETCPLCAKGEPVVKPGSRT